MSRDLVIGTNVAAMEAQRCMQHASSKLTVAQRELGSGSRVSDPSYDPSSASIGLIFDANINTLIQGSRNAAQGAAVLQMFLGIIADTSSILSRLASLSTQANTDVMSDEDRGMLNLEYQDLLNQITKNANITWQNGEKFLANGATLHVQTDQSSLPADLVALNFQSITLDTLQLSNTDLTNMANAQHAESVIIPAISILSGLIADLGAVKNQMDYTIETNNVTVQGMMGAKSTFVDADIAESLMAVQSNQALFDMSTAAFQRSATRASQLAQIVASTLSR